MDPLLRCVTCEDSKAGHEPKEMRPCEIVPWQTQLYTSCTSRSVFWWKFSSHYCAPAKMIFLNRLFALGHTRCLSGEGALWRSRHLLFYYDTGMQGGYLLFCFLYVTLRIPCLCIPRPTANLLHNLETVAWQQ